MERPTASRIVCGEMRGVMTPEVPMLDVRSIELATVASPHAMAKPAMVPMMPPVTHSAADSVRNWAVMSRLVAPSARLMPISRMRSVTLVSIMFMMPMPPTKREMPATAPMMSWKDIMKLLSESMEDFIE